jgi:Sulfotransferase family
MRDALVLGSGRSGTSLLAGLFHKSSYFSGENLWPPTESNEAGYFEDVEVNRINEDLLNKVAPWRPPGIVGALWPLHRDRPRYTQRWLSTLPVGTIVESDSTLDVRMAQQTRNRPYLFKDPRFCYTLSAWAPHLAKDTLFMCVFREPQRTVESIIKIIRNERYLWDLSLSAEGAFRYWEAAYRSVLHYRTVLGGEWLFLHYDEILDGRPISLLEEKLGATVDRDMLRIDLKHSSGQGDAIDSASDLYQELLDLSLLKYS